jgi:predicted DNA-binding transcriptional regulator YafY
MTTSARLLRLLTLLQARPVWSGPDLAERLEVTSRSVRRDVERLRELGYPVHAVSGPGGGYRLGSGRALPPLLLDDDEAVAVVVSLRTAAAEGSVAGISELSLSALAKLEQVLPARLRDRVTALQASTVAIGGGLTPVPADLLVQLARACQSAERVTFGYASRDGTASSRRVEPHRLVHASRRWYLVARDVTAAQWRTFRVDRMSDVVGTGHRFIAVDPPDAARFVSEAISSAPYRFRADVVLRAPYEEIVARVPATVATVTRIDAATCRLQSGSDSLDAIAMHLGLLGCDFSITSPPELEALVAGIGARMLRSRDVRAQRSAP